jgi:AP-4 complex subunit beta-1
VSADRIVTVVGVQPRPACRRPVAMSSSSHSGVPPGYFVDHKRGEVNELKLLLNNPKLLRELDKKKEVVKKVIAYMTLGIDVSKVFSEMIMAASTKDLVQKKMVYHYLCNYAQQKADLAILAINTLQKDSRDEDPMVRGLALRSLCSLRIANIAEYVMIPLRQSLNDPSAYVRKTAVLGIAKLFQFVPENIRQTDLVDILYNMLKDKDTQVITNVIHALNEILATEGPVGGANTATPHQSGMVINHAIMLHLLNRIKDFNEWGQTLILELTAKYKPKDENSLYDIMNLLEDRLKHSNSAVVLGTTKVFLNYTKDMPKVHEEVFKRLKAPLLTLMTGGSHELSFAMLSHINILVQKHPHIFTDSYKHFYW